MQIADKSGWGCNKDESVTYKVTSRTKETDE